MLQSLKNSDLYKPSCLSSIEAVSDGRYNAGRNTDNVGNALSAS